MKCKYRIEFGEYGDWNCTLPGGKKCPNVERLAHKCIIKSIPRKPKRTITVKAWAYLSYGQVEIQGHNCIQPSFPCSIVMLKEDWKYLNTKGDKCLKRS